MNIVEKLAAEGFLTEEQVERIGRNVSEIVKAAQEDPGLMEEALEKMALPAPKGFLGKSLRHAKEYAPWAVGSAIVGGGLTLGSKATQLGFTAVKDHIQKAKAYGDMLETHPELQKANPDMVQKGFNTLFRFNPQFARDPLVAGTFVQNIVDQERLNLSDVKALVDARKAMAPDKGIDFFRSLPPADIATKMHSSSFDPEEDPSVKKERDRLSGLKGETAEYQRTRAKHQADEARARAATANMRWAKEKGL